MALSSDFAQRMQAGTRIEEAVSILDRTAVPALYWRSANLGKWAAAQGFATLLSYKDEIRAVMTRCLELDANYFFAGPHRYFGAFYARAPYAFPPFLDFVPALGPATLLAATCLGAPVSSDEARRARRHLVAWAILGGLLVLARPVHFSLQFLVGIGVPVLALGALGLSRLRPGWTLIATAALGTTAIYAVFFFLLRPNPYYFVPAERLEAARALRPFCRPGDLALTPPDIGQYLAGLTACRAWVSHEIAPEHAERLALLNAFYTSMTPAERASVLDRLGIQEVLLPGDAGEVPGGWLGEATPFRRVAMVGPERARLSLYSRHPVPPSP